MIVSNSYVIDGDGVIVIEGVYGFISDEVYVEMYPEIPSGLGLGNDGTGDTTETVTEGWVTADISYDDYTMTVVVPDVDGVVNISLHNQGVYGEYPESVTEVIHVFPEITLNAISTAPTWDSSGWDNTDGSESGVLETQYILEYIREQDIFMFTAVGYPVYFDQLFVHGTLVVDGEAVGHAVGNRVLSSDILVPDEDGDGFSKRNHGSLTYIFYKTVFAKSVPPTDNMYLMFEIDGAVFRKRVQWNGERFIGPSPMGVVGIQWIDILFDHFGRGNGNI